MALAFDFFHLTWCFSRLCCTRNHNFIPYDGWKILCYMNTPCSVYDICWLTFGLSLLWLLTNEAVNIRPMWCSGKESICQCRRRRRLEFDPRAREIPWSRKWQPTSVFLAGESHGRRSLVGYSPRGHGELDTTERLSTHTHKYSTTNFCVEICFHFSWMYTWE